MILEEAAIRCRSEWFHLNPVELLPQLTPNDRGAEPTRERETTASFSARDSKDDLKQPWNSGGSHRLSKLKEVLKVTQTFPHPGTNSLCDL